MAPVDLSRIFKAYDVRGTVPDRTERRRGPAHRRRVRRMERRQRDPRRARRPPLLSGARRSPDRRRHVARTSTSSTSGSPRPTCSISPRARSTARRDDHREPQPQAVQRLEVLPRAREAGRGGVRPRRDPGADREGRRDPRDGARRGPAARRPGCLRRSRAHVHGRGTDATPHGRGGHGERDGRSRRAGGDGAAPVTLHHLYAELDGTFPNHPADPIDPENQRDLKRAVLEHGADVGMAFDGDADRVFLVDERADDVSGSMLTALVAAAMLDREPGAKVVHNLICSWTVPEVIREHGGVPVRTRVGHSFIKQVMAETGAIFGGEHSGHYYFRDNYGADSGLIAAVIALGELSARLGPAVRAPGAVPPLRELRRDQLPRGRSAGDDRGDRGGAPRRPPGPARRPDGRVRRLVVQRPAVEHGAAAAAERGGPDGRDPGGQDGGGPRPDRGAGRRRRDATETA